MHTPTIDQQVTFLYCRDLETTARFYQDTLGLRLVLDQGSCRIYRVTESAFVGFCQREGIPAAKEGVIFTLVSQDVDGWYRYLLEKDVVIEKPPAENPQYNIYHLFLRDPDGYLIEIQRFNDPAWPQE
jgi:catechol 2,3-dioxygenase-like lactoylglutathione lyase family enzyme